MRLAFAVGAVVRLKTGGPDMTVESVNANAKCRQVACVWFVAAPGGRWDGPKFEEFAEEMLALTEPPSPLVVAADDCKLQAPAEEPLVRIVLPTGESASFEAAISRPDAPYRGSRVIEPPPPEPPVGHVDDVRCFRSPLPVLDEDE